MSLKKDIYYHSQEKVIETYDYRITRSYEFEHKYITLDRWISEMKEKGFTRILDFGCGTGNVSLHALRSGLSPVAVDTSLEMLKMIKKKIGNEHSSFVRGDGESLPFRDRSFDAAVCMGVLHHIPDKVRAVKEMIRVVRKGGKIYVAEPFLTKSVIFKIYDALLFLPRLAKNIFAGLKNLDTESPVTLEELERIKRAVVEEGKTASSFFYLYPPHLFRFFTNKYQKKIFLLLNRHVKVKKDDDIWKPVQYRAPGTPGNILEVHIQC
ncbi:MAG: class I SAM-dependent methyltransferase [Candidatus Aureabacteria bacterium]|nr:class I SAM-dependent methyltransferase [Candidatus Auribacterota bacterium]